MPAGAFICFAPEDAAAAETVRAWLDEQKIRAALSPHLADLGGLPQQTAQILGDTRCLVALVSEHGEASEAMRREAVYAVSNARPTVLVQLGEMRSDGWQRLILDGRTLIDARGGLTPSVREALLQAVRAANATGRVIAMLNIKGGVGKTVLAANLFAAAHMVDRRSVVFVDLDPQHNLTQYFLPSAERNRLRDGNQTLYSAFIARGEAALSEEAFSKLPVALNRSQGGRKPRLDLVLGDERLFEFTLDMIAGREKDDAFARFHALIALLRAKYQAVVIDTNPCATFLTRCAITAADHIVAPVRPEKYSLSGLNLLEHVTRLVRQRPVRPAEFSILLNGVGERRHIAGVDIDAITREEIATAPFFGSALLPVAIPFSTLLRATPADRYAANPINVTAIMRFSQRALKETLTEAAAAILARADSNTPTHAPEHTQSA